MKKTARLPSAMEDELRRIGRDLKTARLSRDMSQEELGSRLGVSFHTVRSMEEGRPGTAIGTYVHALWLFGLGHTLKPVGDPSLDSEGAALRMADLRRGASGSAGPSNDF
ncbi:MAG: helix-turn-helix transcriptional regulator [Phycisphaerales bacterium]|nr:helix-turn-helix transcriptional regulator [Phycisphaerales bacterium]